jgi:hypothetical protein
MEHALTNIRYRHTRPRLGAVASGQGTIDNGGPVDRLCASWVDPGTPSGQIATAAEESGLQAWSYENFGVPYYAPSMLNSVTRFTATVLGAFAAGYHGYARSGGKTGTMLLWGLAGFVFPLPALGVAVIDGYGQRKSRAAG